MMTATEIAYRVTLDLDIAAGLTVIGSGPLATELAELLDTDGSAPRSLIVVVSNQPDQIRKAFEDADDLGTVVLACSDPPAHVDIDVYGDLHARGLVVIGLV